MKISPALKGSIIAACIIIASAVAYNYYGNFDNAIQLISYAIYAAGITWTLLSYHRIDVDRKFKNYFSQGFKCFIVVTLIMVVATWLFVKFNLKLQEDMVAFQAKQMRLDPNLTEVDIDQRLKSFRKFILPSYTMGTIISYLGIGALITAIVSLFLSRFKKVV